MVMKQEQTWLALRSKKQSAVAKTESLASIPTLIEALTPEQQPAAREALRVATAGASLPLDDALQIEEAAFVPLVASENARRLIAGFLKR
jgi:hypothetical protein